METDTVNPGQHNLVAVELFQPPRVSKVACTKDWTHGACMDLLTGWDFDRTDHRKKAEQRAREEKPELLIGSPPCTLFPKLQEPNKAINKDDPAWIRQFELAREKAARHIRFCCKLYRIQMDENRYFLHEHPWSASSWNLPDIKDVLKDHRVMCVEGHQCQYGLETYKDKKGGTTGPAKTPTGFMSNSWCLMEELKEKFETSAKMKAKYEIYQRKRLAIIQTIKNSLQENDLMLEIVTSH